MNFHRLFPAGVTVEAVLGVLLVVSVGTLVVPSVSEAFKQRAVADVARKLSELTRAKSAYLISHESDGSACGVVELVPEYIDRWPCSVVGQCSDFKTGELGRPSTFKGVTLVELEDPVTFLGASDRIYGSPRDFLFKQG